MTWEWISNQALPIALLIIFFVGIQRGEVFTKRSFGLMTEQRDDARKERDNAIEKMERITREQYEAQAEERAAMVARIATLEAKLAESTNARERQPEKGAR